MHFKLALVDEMEVKQTKSESTADSKPKTLIAKPLAAGQVKAKNIEKKEMFGKVDTYVKMTLDN